MGRLPDDPFDVEAFLAQPLTAHLATNGPTIRPVWYLWEDGAFWILTGSWSRLADRLATDPHVALTVDICDLTSGEVRKVQATGAAEVVPYDAQRARRKLARYLGPDESRWDTERFGIDAMRDTAQFVRFAPSSLVARDLSFRVAGA